MTISWLCGVLNEELTMSLLHNAIDIILCACVIIGKSGWTPIDGG